MTDPCHPQKPGDYPSDCDLLAAYRQRAHSQNPEESSHAPAPLILTKAKEVTLLLLTIDGVLTDGSLHHVGPGELGRFFYHRDLTGISILLTAGIRVALLFRGAGATCDQLATALGVEVIKPERQDREMTTREIFMQAHCKPFETAFIGDDWPDLPLLGHVGLATAPASCDPEVRRRVHYVTRATGGRGAVREICELLLQARGQKVSCLAEHIRG